MYKRQGMGFAGGMYLVPLMNGDVIDYDESITGLRHEGMYAGVNLSLIHILARSATVFDKLWFKNEQKYTV